MALVAVEHFEDERDAALLRARRQQRRRFGEQRILLALRRHRADAPDESVDRCPRRSQLHRPVEHARQLVHRRIPDARIGVRNIDVRRRERQDGETMIGEDFRTLPAVAREVRMQLNAAISERRDSAADVLERQPPVDPCADTKIVARHRLLPAIACRIGIDSPPLLCPSYGRIERAGAPKKGALIWVVCECAFTVNILIVNDF